MRLHRFLIENDCLNVRCRGRCKHSISPTHETSSCDIKLWFKTVVPMVTAHINPILCDEWGWRMCTNCCVSVLEDIVLISIATTVYANHTKTIYIKIYKHGYMFMLFLEYRPNHIHQEIIHFINHMHSILYSPKLFRWCNFFNKCFPFSL